MSATHHGDNVRIVNPDVMLTMMQLAISKGYSVIPCRSGHHWFPLDFIQCELLGKISEKSFGQEISDWRKTGLPVPEKFPGAVGKYYRIFDFLDSYHDFKKQEASG